jgi:hypothetical protein
MKNWVEICLIDCFKTLRSTVAKPGPRKYSTFWPKHPDKCEEVIDDRYVGDVGHMDIVLYTWLPLLSEQQKKIVCRRWCGNKPIPWKIIGKENHCSREKVRLEYYDALMILERKVPNLSNYQPGRIAQICSVFSEI